MKHDPTEIKLGLHHIANEAVQGTKQAWKGQAFRDSAIDALAYIRHLEGELRRQGFNEYTDKEETND